MAKIDQNGKGLAFTILLDFRYFFNFFKNGSKRPKTTISGGKWF